MIEKGNEIIDLKDRLKLSTDGKCSRTPNVLIIDKKKRPGIPHGKCNKTTDCLGVTNRIEKDKK